MTTGSIAQYLEQKRVVRPIDWSATGRQQLAPQPAPRPRSVLPLGEPARDTGGFRRMSLASAPEPLESAPADEDPVTMDEDAAPGGRRGYGVFRSRETAPPPPLVDIESQLAEAYHRGVQEGLDAARNEAATQRAMERAEVQKRAVVDRVDFQMNEFARLGETIAQGLIEIERRVAETTARLLQPFLAEAVSRKVIEDLAAKIATLSNAGHPSLMKIRGPEAQLAKLKSRIEPLAIQVEYVATGGIEVSVEAQHTAIRSELASWAELLANLSETR